MATGHIQTETVTKVTGYTLELTPGEAEYLFGLVGALRCRPIKGEPEFNWDIFNALKDGAHVPRGDLYNAARAYGKRVVAP